MLNTMNDVRTQWSKTQSWPDLMFIMISLSCPGPWTWGAPYQAWLSLNIETGLWRTIISGPESEDGPIHSGGNIILQIKSDIEIILSLKVDFNFTQEFQECEGIFLHYWKASWYASFSWFTIVCCAECGAECWSWQWVCGSVGVEMTRVTPLVPTPGDWSLESRPGVSSGDHASSQVSVINDRSESPLREPLHSS